ncbi:carbohydrate binding domain-containing protein [Candidatus Poribacteria bacterium]
MRFRLNYFIVFISVMLILAPNSIAQEIENLLTNPDFEIDTEGWSLGNENFFGIDEKEECPTQTNVVSAIIDNVGANPWEPEIHSPSFALAQGNTYTYSFWAKTEEGETKSINSSFESNDPVWAGAGGMAITLTDEWVEYHSTSVWNNEFRGVVVIHIAVNYPPTELNDMWIAHAKVYEGDYVEEEIEGLEPEAVTPVGNLAIPWGQIKSR